MSPDRLEASGVIVGDKSFGLVDKDARFARWDAKKSLRWQESEPRLDRRLKLFENTTNEDLLDKMRNLHASVTKMEQGGLDRSVILRALLTETPNLNDYDLLFRKTPWGEELRLALCQETYRQDEYGALWDDFVVGRIHSALGGVFKSFERYDGRFSYQIDTPKDVLRFNPESNGRANDDPEFHLRGNRIEKTGESSWDTDQRLAMSIKNVTEVRVGEVVGKLEVFKDLGESRLRLMYQRKIIGSTHQIEIDLVPK